MKLKEIKGKFYQECDVVMLATKQTSNGRHIVFNEQNKLCIRDVWSTDSQFTLSIQHLYILSNEEIKEGDWYFDSNYKLILQATNVSTNILNKEYKKVIATTDSSLRLKCGCSGMQDKVKCNWMCQTHRDFELPQPSESFIKKFIQSYNEGNVITKALVQFEKCYAQQQNSEIDLEYYRIKADGANQITTIKLKDSWSKEEHILNLLNYRNDLLVELTRCRNLRISLKKEFTDKWIEQNL